MTEKQSLVRKMEWQNPEIRKKRCKALSIARKKLWQNPEYRKKNKGSLGYKFTERQRENVKKAAKRRVLNPKYREKIRKITKRRWTNSELNIGMRDKKHTEKTKIKMSEKHKGKILSEEHKRKIREATNKRLENPKERKRMSKETKRRWQNGGFDGLFQSPTKPEKEIIKILKDLKLDFIFQFRPENFSMIYDFYISKLNLLIEFDGAYWHSKPGVKKRDLEKTKYAKDNGFNLLRFNENNLNNFSNIIFNKTYL